MTLYEALYGCKCRSPLYCDEVGKKQLLGPEIVQDTKDKITLIRERMLMAQSRQKSYANQHRRKLEFEVGSQVFLKVSPMKGVIQFGKKGKLSPRYIGPFEVKEVVGPVAYRVALPSELAGVHDVFHISTLRSTCMTLCMLSTLNLYKLKRTCHTKKCRFKLWIARSNN
jgi:hypothetical protein